MSGTGPLRRWKRFFPAFGHIDAVIEAAHPSISRDEFRSVRGRIVEMLCDAEDDDERAEQLCLALDGAMAESLVTLLGVPVSSRAVASGDLARSVSALGHHESARIRSLTRDVVRGWRSAVESELDSARAAMEVLNNLSSSSLMPLPPEKERVASVVNNTTNVPVATGKDEMQIKEKMQIKDTPAKFLSKRTPVTGSCCSEADKVLATKRKLREDYQEAENAKLQRKSRVVSEDRKVSVVQTKQKQKLHPVITPESSRARCGSVTTVRHSLMPSFGV